MKTFNILFIITWICILFWLISENIIAKLVFSISGLIFGFVGWYSNKLDDLKEQKNETM